MSTLDEFTPGVTTSDTRKRIQTHADLVTYLKDPCYSLSCLEIDEFIGGLVAWVNRSNYKRRCREIGGYLVKIDNSADQSWLFAEAMKTSKRDSLKNHNGLKFSTKDNDNDSYEKHCATMYKGAWWYRKCHLANLNGLYLNGTHSAFATGMVWYKWKGHYYSFMKTKMMMRRIKRHI